MTQGPHARIGSAEESAVVSDAIRKSPGRDDLGFRCLTRWGGKMLQFPRYGAILKAMSHAQFGEAAAKYKAPSTSYDGFKASVVTANKIIDAPVKVV
ncbi:hypothetical protein CEXT_333091 [Caerostris extrusa]|uniref:Uncharacterized protein n=1 Tax=Caerostris extrusa TaxID=172846 RepID=A0AAV4VHG9_CAEEX|nr:hypothetical protein CEXT_333091 [Caerostris extrusa]